MHCPQCGRKYRDRVTQCSVCQMALAPGVPSAATEAAPEVMIFESSNPFLTAMARGALEDSGIPFRMQGDETYTRQMMGPLMFSPNRFFVTQDREAEARDLLQQLEAPIEEHDPPSAIPR